MQKIKEKLFRKENKLAGHYRGDTGGDFRHERHSKTFNENLGEHTSMKRGVQRGVDYTPLFRFLLSRVGKNWDEVYSEAVSRLDKSEPIFWMVAQHEQDKKAKVRIGESSYWSGLYIAEDNTLQIVDPELTNEKLHPSCHCCTHTFNGKVFVNKMHPDKRS